MFKRFLFLFVFGFLFLVNSAFAKEITLAYIDFPPYEFENKGKPSGVLVDIVETIFKRAEISLKLKYLPFKDAYEQTINGQIDGVFDLYKTEERLKYFDYTEWIIKNPLMFFVRKDSDIQFNRPADLKGLRIGIMPGYTYGTEFDESELFVKEESETHLANMKKLVMGRIDAFVCDKLVGLSVAIKNNLMSELKILPSPLRIMDGYIGFTKGKCQKEIEKLDEVINQMHKAGEIDKMIDDYVANML
ncbi:transporter substrate-binding domain-containing protein [bacterium]|nr:transporter substrate-binding domain-containing protein [bacterium]